MKGIPLKYDTMAKRDEDGMIGRIDIQGHGFCDQEMNVNRSMPAVLS